MKFLAFSNDIIRTATLAHSDHVHGIDNVLYDIPRATTMNTSYNYTVKTFGLLQPYYGRLSCMPVVYVTRYKLQGMLPN